MLTGLLLLACFLIATTHPEVRPTLTVGWVPLQGHSLRERPTGLPTAGSDGQIFTTEVPSAVDSSLGQVDITHVTLKPKAFFWSFQMRLFQAISGS